MRMWLESMEKRSKLDEVLVQRVWSKRMGKTINSLQEIIGIKQVTLNQKKICHLDHELDFTKKDPTQSMY